MIARARLGFIIPSSNRMVEPQMQRYAPSGVAPHFTRLRMTNRHRKPLRELLPEILNSVSLLMDSKCDVIVFQCTGTSMSGGVEADELVVSAIAKHAERPGISTAGAVRAAFSALAARRIVFISETGPEGHAKKLSYLREAGYDVVRDHAASLSGSDAYCTTPPEYWRDLALELRDERADAYFISCANIQSMDVIEELETKLEKPVITSNQAALWAALRLLGISAPGPGQLFKTIPPSPFMGEGGAPFGAPGEGTRLRSTPKQFARQLRRNMTDDERKLWFELRNRRFTGAKFRRQQPIGPYIVDFVCFEMKLIIELDGGQHGAPPNRAADARRTAFLESQGFRVTRYWNMEVKQNFDVVLESIHRDLGLNGPSPGAPRRPLPQGEREN